MDPKLGNIVTTVPSNFKRLTKRGTNHLNANHPYWNNTAKPRFQPVKLFAYCLKLLIRQLLPAGVAGEHMTYNNMLIELFRGSGKEIRRSSR